MTRGAPAFKQHRDPDIKDPLQAFCSLWAQKLFIEEFIPSLVALSRLCRRQLHTLQLGLATQQVEGQFYIPEWDVCMLTVRGDSVFAAADLGIKDTFGNSWMPVVTEDLSGWGLVFQDLLQDVTQSSGPAGLPGQLGCGVLDQIAGPSPRLQNEKGRVRSLVDQVAMIYLELHS